MMKPTVNAQVLVTAFTNRVKQREIQPEIRAKWNYMVDTRAKLTYTLYNPTQFKIEEADNDRQAVV